MGAYIPVQPTRVAVLTVTVAVVLDGVAVEVPMGDAVWVIGFTRLYVTPSGLVPRYLINR
jgi:hypothetical protein